MEDVMGTKSQLMSFFKKYKNHTQLSDRCALDGRYFWKVLHPYGGLIRSEMYFRLNDLGEDGVQISPPAWDYREYFDNKSPERYRLVKIIIDIARDPEDNQGSVHSNLLYFDLKKKEIVRFEPMMEEKYTDLVNDVLKPFLEGMLPDFTYRMRSDHPQLPTTEKCPRKGFCAAYTLKSAMLIVNGMEDVRMNRAPEIEEEKIMVFSSAIEQEYGSYGDWEEEDDDEFGWRRRRPGFGRRRPGWGGVLAAGAIGLALGSFINLGRPNYVEVAPAVYPGRPMYSAPYYGYTYGPRYGGSPGWGWGRPGWAAYGYKKEYGCGCSIPKERKEFYPN